jgi:hypothetical protein
MLSSLGMVKMAPAGDRWLIQAGTEAGLPLALTPRGSMSKVVNMPIPARFRSVRDCLSVAQQQNLGHVLVLSALSHDRILIMPGSNDNELTEAEIVWLLEQAKRLVLEGKEPSNA